MHPAPSRSGNRIHTFLALLAILPALPAAPAPRWTPQTSGIAARLRGVSAVNARVAWASGAQGTILRTADRGQTWQRLTIPGTAQLDFRDIDAVGEHTAYALSIGPGEASRIYKTSDAGATWTLQFTNHDPKAFYDALTFWSPTHGIAISDSVQGRFVVLLTRDGGATWTPIAPGRLPAALPGEGAFAASGTNIAVHGKRHVWIGTGAGRVLHSADGGSQWQAAHTGLATSPTAGIFSIAFRNARHGLVVGGDYKQEAQALDNASLTEDGGRSWRLVKGLSGFRSVIAWLNSATAIAIGPSGSDLSRDGGRTWAPVSGPGFHALSAVPHAKVGWGVGEGGRIALLRW